ncbi:MAG: RNA-binding protein [Phormidesmis sp.]
MFKISGLPVNVTKEDLGEFLSPYGKIKTTDIEVGDSTSTAFVELENQKKERQAIKDLDRTEWPGSEYVLKLDPIRGNGTLKNQPGDRQVESEAPESQTPKGEASENSGNASEKTS